MFVKKLLPLIPEHRTYAEVFGGGASLLFAKPPSYNEMYNDLDSTLTDFFRLLQNESEFEVFYQKCLIACHSRELRYEYRDTWHEQTDKIERVFRWFVVARQSFGGRFGGSWGFALVRNKAMQFRGVVERLA